MCNISVLSEMSFQSSDISSANAKMVKLFCVKRNIGLLSVLNYLSSVSMRNGCMIC